MFQSTFTLRSRLKNENSVRKHRTFPEESLKDKITTPQSQRVNNEVNITIQFKTFVVPYCDLQCLANHKFAFPSTVTRFCVLINQFTFLSRLAIVCIYFVGSVLYILPLNFVIRREAKFGKRLFCAIFGRLLQKPVLSYRALPKRWVFAPCSIRSHT